MKPLLLSRRPVYPVLRLVASIALVLSFLLTATVPTFAAGGTTGNLAGVLLTPDGKPVANTTVTIAGPAAGRYTQQTDSSGHFQFLTIPIDTYILSAEPKGYGPFIETGLTVQGGANLNVGNLTLQKELNVIGKTRANAGNTSAFQPSTLPSTTISGAQLEAAGGKAAQTNGDQVLLSVPGFQQDSARNLILQGSLTDQIRYQFDGVDFTDPGFNGSINNNFFNGIGTVQVVPGAGDPSQGNVGAGAVNLIARRGTYPGSGLFDFESLTKPYGNQYQLSYGLASRNQEVSDYFSLSATRNATQNGVFGSSAADNNALYSTGQRNVNDFVNNFVVRFGKDRNQSFQFLYLNDFARSIGNYGNLTLQYPSSSPDLLPFVVGPTGLTTGQAQSVIGFEAGQTSITQTIPQPVTNDNSQTNFLKFEYDNQIDPTTSLALRYFTQSRYDVANAAGATTYSALPILRAAQTSGGSRVGTNFEINKQFGSKNLVTASGSFEVNKPDFGSTSPYVGLVDAGGFAQDFLTPPNTSQPLSDSNACPVVGGCYLYGTTGRAFKVPGLVLQSTEVQDEYGVGLRDQVSLSGNFKVDVGLRYDLINEGFGKNLLYADENTQPVPGAPTQYFIGNYGFVNGPHFLQPRLGFSDKVTPRDAVSASYGRSIILQGLGELASPESQTAYNGFSGIPINPAAFTNGVQNQSGGDIYAGISGLGTNNCFSNLPFPVGATAASKPSYNGKIGSTLQFGRPCANYADLLYSLNDAFYPEVTAVQPGVFNNYDFTYSHLFSNGSAIKLNPYYRQGANVQAITANLINVNGTFQPGTLTSQSVGRSYTTGLDLQFTLPDRPSGVSGFISASYTNEFTNTPPSSDNPNGQDFEPLIQPQSLAAGNLYRAGFVSPFVMRFGPVYKSRGGLRFNPVLSFDAGFPIGAGLLTPVFYGSGALNVPNTNFTNQYAANGAPQYVDPANPGSIFNPVVAATRGTPETASGGGALTKPRVTGDVNLQYEVPHSNSTFGASVLNVFGNEFGSNGVAGIVQPALIVSNGRYLPVTTGVAAPLTGQNPNHRLAPGLIPLISPGVTPFSAYRVGAFAPPEYRVYFQHRL